MAWEAGARRTGDMFDHQQVVAMDLIGEVRHPKVGSYKTLQHPHSRLRTPCGKPFAAPLLGERSHGILSEESYSARGVDQLVTAGLLGQPQVATSAAQVQRLQPNNARV